MVKLKSTMKKLSIILLLVLISVPVISMDYPEHAPDYTYREWDRWTTDAKIVFVLGFGVGFHAVLRNLMDDYPMLSDYAIETNEQLLGVYVEDIVEAIDWLYEYRSEYREVPVNAMIINVKMLCELEDYPLEYVDGYK